ncbi:hypothetical protein C0389_04325 [bacterium]|nr:hypothetical protein [bacterium]
MSKLTDEILNKYIDGELDSYELKNVQNELEKDGFALARLRALRMVDNSLRQIEVEQTSVNFTDKVMKAIALTKSAVKPKVNYFFISITSIFSIGVLAALIAAFRSEEKSSGPSAITPYAERLKDLMGKNLTALQHIFADPNVMLIISVFSLILLVGAYFTFEAHKNFTKKLNSISH